MRLLQILSASLLTLKYCGRTLGWSVGGNYSSAASIAYSNLLLQLTLILAPLLLPSEQADGRITTALPRWATCAIPPPELELDLALDSTIDMNELRPFALQLAQEFTQVYDNYFQKLPTNDAMLHTAIPCPDSRKTVLRVLLHNIASIDTSVTKDRKETRSIQDIATKLLNILQSELFLQKTLLGSDNASGRTSQKQSPSVSITSGKSVAEDFLLQITATHPLEKQLPELVASQSSYLELLDSLYIAEKDTLLRNSYRAIFEGFKAACEGLVTPVADGIISSVQTMTEELVALYISHQLPYSLTLRQQVTIVDRSFTSLLTTDSLAVATVLQSPIFNSISRPNLLQFRYVGFDFEAHLHSVFRYLHDKSTGALTGNSGSAASYQLHSSEYLELIHSTENLKEEHAEQAEASARVLHLLVKLSSSHGYKSSSYSKSDAIRASTSDVLSIIDDALLPHLPCADKISFSVNDQFDALVHPIVTDFAPSLSHYQERRWSQLSGSADMFVVLGCVSADPLGQIVRFRLRIINSSGFKVPSFSIQVALRYNSYAPRGTLNSESETYKSYFSTSADWSSNSIEPVSLLADEPYTAPGDEYFLPGAYIEREFVYQLSDLGSFQLLPRLVFEDVEFEDSKVLFNSSEQQPNDATTSPGKVRPDVSDEEDPAIPSPVGRSKTDAVTIETVSLECEPFPVGLVHQLFPYGQYALNGNISSHPDAFPAGIPSAVFLQQWERLNTRAKDRIGVKLDDKLRSVVEASMLGLAESRLPLSEKLTLLSRRVEKFVTYSVQCAMAQSNVSPHESLARLGVAARVDLADEAHYMLLPSVSILSSFNTTGSSNDTSLLAWSLQTFRGDEIAILVSLPSRSVFSGTFTAPYSASTFVDSRLSAFSKNVGTVFDSKSPNSMKQPSVNSSTDCWMEVRCSNSHTLKVVLEDIGNMIFVLSVNSVLLV